VPLIDDLIELECLAEQETDSARRRRLVAVHDHMASRSEGVKVSQAAAVLGLSAPTIRAWIEAGMLDTVPDFKPVRITPSSVASAKRAVDAIRPHVHDRQLLNEVGRLLETRSLLSSPEAHAALADLEAGRTIPLTPKLLDELLPKRTRRSKSS